ncbi:MAG: peptidase T [Odoribacter sp.]|nr:peptidase T [Odoribacter sp.]
MELKERFLKYVSFDTQSDPESETYPSAAKELILLNHLAEEMKDLGLEDVEVDANGYAMGTIPATPGYESRPVIGFISHVDTSPDMSGANIKPQIIENYDGNDIRLNENLMMRVADFPELSFYKGHTLITTDGTTLLGADDKAGIAEIMTAAEYIMAHPEIKHGKIRLGFTPDEEIGRGVDFFDVEHFGAKFAYTIDGGFEGELEYENFNAASAKIEVQGQNIHPGYAKDKMINALQVVAEINTMLPPCQRPEHTEGYEGFYHLVSIKGEVECASSEYIIRDHSREKFEAKKEYMQKIVDLLNAKYGAGVIKLTLKDQYYNMREQVEPYPEVIDKAFQAMSEAGVKPIVRPIRGGTDGARLSYMGLPCPNLFTGGMNFHGKYEYCSLNTMEKAMNTIINLIVLWGK